MTKTRAEMATIVLNLLAKSKGTDSEAEAATFATKAHDLILKYNLDEMALNAAERESGKNRDYVHSVLGVVLETWKQQLGWVVGETNFCKVVRFKQPNSRNKQGYDMALDCIGLPQNVEAVQYLFTFLRREIDRLGHKSWKEASIGDKYGTTETKWWNAFCVGAVSVVGERLRAQMRAETNQKGEVGDQVRALVVLTEEELKRATKQFYPVLGTARQRQQHTVYEAEMAGRQAGANIPLTRGIAGK
jgi:hypothetical protein